MAEIKSTMDKAGVIVLADAWLAGAFASKKGCIRDPDDVKGVKFRSAGKAFAEMWRGAGASIVSVPSSEVYTGMQTGVIEATDTSSGSFVSFRLYEQVKCLTAPGQNALWFMYEPVLMAKKKFESLTAKQRDALKAAGKKSEDYFDRETRNLDEKMVEAFKKANVEVAELTPTQFAKWRQVAKDTSYKVFAEKVAGGDKLIEKALAVQ
jgi:TRAP-type C4-dicarboxylate transport system substrate-binding protein